MIDKLTTLYPAIPENTLTILLDNAEYFVKDYCGISYVPDELESALFAIVQEDINKLYSEGFTSESVGGNAISFDTDYSPRIYKRLKRHKKIRYA